MMAEEPTTLAIKGPKRQDQDRIARILQSFEKQRGMFKNIRFKIMIKRPVKISGNTEGEWIQVPGQYGHVSSEYEFNRDGYYALNNEMWRTDEKSGKRLDEIYLQETFNGKEYRSYVSREFGVISLAPPPPPEGFPVKNPTEFMPHFYKPVIDRALSNAASETITETADGLWLLDYEDERAFYEITFDPQKDFMITKILTTMKTKDKSKSTTNIIEKKIEYQQIPGGFWRPVTAVISYPGVEPEVATFTEFELNGPAGDYTLKFPEGVPVKRGANVIQFDIPLPTRPEIKEPASLLGKPLLSLEAFQLGFDPEKMKSKRILICFWDMNQRPSRNCITELAKKYEDLTRKGVTIAAIQASKVDEQSLQEWINQNNISFPVGRIEGDQKKIKFQWGVRALPWMILTDEKHVVEAEGFDLDKLDEIIKLVIKDEYDEYIRDIQPLKEELSEEIGQFQGSIVATPEQDTYEINVLEIDPNNADWVRIEYDKADKGNQYPEKETAFEPDQKRKVYIPECEIENAKVILDLASGDMLADTDEQRSEHYLNKLGRGDIAYDYQNGTTCRLICFRGTTLRNKKSYNKTMGFKIYYLGDIPCWFQATTPEGDIYEVEIYKIDAGDNGGIYIEYWKSEKPAEERTENDLPGQKQ
ncbi:redoxin domain-containing protein [Planctomycetota bacterium]